MSEPRALSRGKPILWLAVLCEGMVVLSSLRGEDYLFAGHGLALGGALGMMAWGGEPAWGTRRANLVLGLLAVCGISLAAAFATQPG